MLGKSLLYEFLDKCVFFGLVWVRNLPSRARGLFLWRYSSKPRKLGPWLRLPGPWKSVEVQWRLLSCPAFPHICVAAKSSRLQWWASRDHLPASIIKEEWDMVVELMKTSILFPRVANTMVKNPKNCRIFPAFRYTLLAILEKRPFLLFSTTVCELGILY